MQLFQNYWFLLVMKFCATRLFWPMRILHVADTVTVSGRYGTATFYTNEYHGQIQTAEKT